MNSGSIPDSEYQYESLPEPTSFRVILLSTTQSDESPIECQMVSLKLEDRPFNALSYMWGPLVKTRTILIDGQPVKVGENLWLAMKAIRFHTRGDTADNTCVWIDAICINQNDIPERNQQVAMMDRIYSEATQVLVWLGPGDEGSDRVIGTLAADYSEDSLVEFDKSDEDSNSWRQLFNRPYFNRMWIVQEIVLGKNIRFLCGTKSIPWSQMVGAFDMYQRGYNIPRALYPRSLLAQLHHAKRRYWGRDGNGGKNAYLLAFLLILESRECYDPRDKLYALLGVAKDARGGAIIADYAKELWMVYQDVILFWSHRKGTNRCHLFIVSYSALVQRSLKQPLEMPKTDDKAFRIPASGHECGTITKLGPAFRLEDCEKADGSNQEMLKRLTGHLKEVFGIHGPYYAIYHSSDLNIEEPAHPGWDYSSDAKSTMDDHTFRLFEYTCSRSGPGQIGIGPRQIKEGDILCATYNTSLALAIRRRHPYKILEFIGCPSSKYLEIIGSVVLFRRQYEGSPMDYDSVPLGNDASLVEWANRAELRRWGQATAQTTRYNQPTFIVLWIDIPTLQRWTRFNGYDTVSMQAE